ncbi:MAG TPA: polysaccharide deacetylase family protein [Noviherbaspirillum sp.]|jgi:peptidoglycan/xylan/chitin deacetylase (PgdA/CDA1 family)|uniref:polysaccharide deacetylase family protein n=1 Tax=Noviherbaspirillum sp. TaxID=1926288 RepID=UPI002F947255
MTISLPILLYHRIDQARSSLSTSPAEFRRHLQWLSERGWRTLSLEQFAFYARSGKELPAHSFLLTFDDGYACLSASAADILREFNFSAVCFLCTRLLRGPQQDNNLAGVDNSCFLDWNQARALQQSGVVEFQSHTHSHEKFGEATQREVMEDLGTSREWLAHELRLPKTMFNHLAWPWGESRESWRLAAMRCGLQYQYTVSRQAYSRSSPMQQMPRTCYDGATLANFQTQFWLQVGPLAGLWNSAYPVLRRLRRPAIEVPAPENATTVAGVDASNGAS